MKPYTLESNDIFLNCGSATVLPIAAFKLKIPSFVTLKGSDFEGLADIGPNQSHDALVIFDVVIVDHGLRRLAETLTNKYLVVNREGLCYVKRKESSEVVLYRLNDLFNWSAYGVKPIITTIWNRCDVLNGDVLINYEDQQKSFEQSQNDLKEKEEEISELKHQLSNCEKQLIQKQEELKVKSCELAESKAEVAELYTELKVKCCELAESKAEVAALHTDLKLQISISKDHEKQLKRKEEDLGKVSSELSDAKSELRFMKTELELSKEKVAEFQAELNQCRAEAELKFTRSELDSLKSTVATLQMEMNQFRAEAELKSIKTELESSKAEVFVLQKKLNQCQAQLAITAVADASNLHGCGPTQVDPLDVQEHTKFNISQSPLSISQRCDVL